MCPNRGGRPFLFADEEHPEAVNLTLTRNFNGFLRVLILWAVNLLLVCSKQQVCLLVDLEFARVNLGELEQCDAGADGQESENESNDLDRVSQGFGLAYS